MSWFFDEVDDYVTLADNAALSFPNGDWSVAGWVKLTDNVGTTFQYFASWNAFGATPSWHWYFGEATAADAALRNKYQIAAKSANGVDFTNGANIPSTSTSGTSTAWQHLTVTYTASTRTIRYYTNGVADGSHVVSGTPDGIDHTGAFYFGSRAVTPTDRYFGGRLAEFAKWNSALNTTQITALAAGDAPSIVGAPAWYCPMVNNFTESVNNITVTAVGSVTDVDHPTIRYSAAATLSGNAAATASASGTLSGGAGADLAGSAASVATASGVLVGAAAVLAGGAVAQAAAAAALSGVTIFNTQDRGTVDLVNSSVTPNGSTPTVFVRNRWFADNSGGARMSFFHVTGVNGLTPVFDVDRSNMENSSATNKFLWSYTGERDSWQEFTTTTRVTSPNVYRSSNSTAFNQDTVYVSMNYPWRISYTLPWIQSLESSGFIGYAPSGGTAYLFETRTATTNGSTAGVGDVIPAQPLYSFKISSGSGNAPDGQPKRKMVMTGGMHAAEDVGNYNLIGAVEFLVSADSQAVTVRDWFDIFVYPVVASAGRAGGATRNDFENSYKSEDVNRSWDDVPVLESITKHKAAVLADVGATFDVLFDWHGDIFTSGVYDYYSSSVAKKSVWETAIRQYIAGIAVTQFDAVGTAGVWAYGSKGARFAVTPEHTYSATLNITNVQAFGANHLRAVAYLIAQGEWGTVPLSAAAAATATAAAALTTGIPLAGAAVGTSTATGDLTAQVSLSGDALAQATAAASLTAGAGGLSGDAAAQSAAAASLTTDIHLAGAAAAQAAASGTLAGGIVPMRPIVTANRFSGLVTARLQ
jgi:hypothetical protein